MPLISLHGAVELIPYENEAQRMADIDHLGAMFPQSFSASDRSTQDLVLSFLRVGWEFNRHEIEAIHVKIMLHGIAHSHDAAGQWLDGLHDTLPSMAPEIQGALAHGIIHLTFDANAEGWTFCPDMLSAHARMTQRQNAIDTIFGRVDDRVEGDLTETWDPRGIPALIEQCPLPDTGH